jgi:hypothetical protein
VRFTPRLLTSLLILLAATNTVALDSRTRAHCIASELEPRIAVTAHELKPRDRYIEENLHTQFTTTEQNRETIKLTNAIEPGSQTLVFRTENALLKKLNDVLQEKNLVTSGNNRFKTILLEKLQVIQKQDGIKVSLYDDYKSSEQVIQWEGKAPANFHEQIDWCFYKANKEFFNELVARKIVRKEDIQESWFRAATGPDEAKVNVTNRIAREMGSENRVVDYDEPWVQTRLKEVLSKAESTRKQIEEELESKISFTQVGDKRIPSRDVFDLIRKSGDNKDNLLQALKTRYRRTDFTAAQADLLLTYARNVDLFSPSLRVPTREVIHVDDADLGGFTADFLGLGSDNHHSVAEALAQAENVDHAIVLARQKEREVTSRFQEKLSAFREIVGETARCGGDDCASLASHHPFTSSEKVELVSRLAANPLTRSIRISFISDGIEVKSDRTKIATQGEDIEKAMRKALAGQIPAARLSEFTIAIDMQTKLILKGSVDMIIGTEPGKPLSAAENKILRRALKFAVYEVNRKISSKDQSSRYRPVFTLHE